MLVSEQTLSLPILSLLIKLLLLLIDALIIGVFEQESLYDSSPILLEYFDADSMRSYVATSEPLHAEVVQKSLFANNREVLFQLFNHFILRLDKSNDDRESVALKLPKSNRLCLSCNNITDPQFSISECDFIEFFENVWLTVVQRDLLGSNAPFILQSGNTKELLVTSDNLA